MKAIVIGTSQGGPKALHKLVSALPTAFPVPVMIVLHRHPEGKERAEKQLDSACLLTVKQAEDKEAVEAGTVYLAPPGYHLLVEDDETLSLSIDDKVNYSRPSIDVLFESAADVYGETLVAILLTGANRDGAEGLRTVKEAGGVTVVQDPADAETAAMPKAALRLMKPDKVMSLSEITCYLKELVHEKTRNSRC